MKNINIKNGVDIHLIDAPKFKTNLLSVYLSIPLSRDTVTYASLLTSVLSRGCEAYPTIRDVSRRLNDMYNASLSVNIRTKGNQEFIYISSRYIADEYAEENITKQVAEFLHNFIFNPLTENNEFIEDFLNSEKVNLKNEIEGIINDKKAYTEFKCRETMFDKKGYGMCEIGYTEDFDSITPQSLLDFYYNILNTAKVDVFLSGSISEAMTDDIANTLVKGFKPRTAEYIKNVIEAVEVSDTRNIVEDADVVQSKLCMGLRCNTDPDSADYPALMLGGCIFGGSPFSKLFNNVREKLSLAYYVSARISKFNGVMFINSGIQTENYQAAYDEIMFQFKKVCDGDMDDLEITAAKKYLSSSLTSVKDTLRGMEDFCLTQLIMGSDECLDDVIASINKVEKTDVCRVMNKIKLDTVYFLRGKLSGEDE